MVDYIPNQDSNNINEDYNNNMEAENYVVSDSSTEHYGAFSPVIVWSEN